ncbi:GAF domain-containing protein [Amycolatopsis carbonis]|uniref:GAF domain-containing protein n=1 Tax=Amycolatopsis carbonis TaxID=715471 RepID=A0A9Y2IBE3_9PSEU|nr:GAF domain-containing protein [Amycolatopsis sp. 2-15]WIX76622.1 GAF domain-containing protein [Amycolatopsis sp. 2-15]
MRAGRTVSRQFPPRPTSADTGGTAVRYVQRTAEILIVDDATRDDRFARDPYIAGLGACSLLAMPILGRGALRAVLVLENRLMRAASATERLDAVRLIAAQLAVSLDNAQLYSDLIASRAYRRRRRPGPSADRARPARWRPATSGCGVQAGW